MEERVKISEADKVKLLEAVNIALRNGAEFLMAKETANNLALKYQKSQEAIAKIMNDIVASYGFPGHEINERYEIVPVTK